MSSCCGVHEDKITINWTVDGPLLYEEYAQNIIFMNIKRSLLIIDSTNYVKYCPQCKKYRGLYIYGTWLNVRVSFDGVTDLPIRTIIHDIDIFNLWAVVDNEPSFGNFIYVYSIYQNIVNTAIIYYPIGKIEWSSFEHCPNIIVDGKPAICCLTIDRKKFMLINSDGEIINVKVVYPINFDEYVFNTGNGILRREYSSYTSYWKYTTNPALKTKAEVRE